MRNGKIAKLPSEVRDDLNLRMRNGEDGATLLQWLNALPTVKEYLGGRFAGLPVTKQNLSAWRKGGFLEWQRHDEWVHQACELRNYAESMDDVLDKPLLAGDLSALLAVRYAALLHAWDGESSPQFQEQRRLLRDLAQDVSLIQRNLHRANLQGIAYHQHSEDEREKHKEKMHQLALSPINAALERNSLEKMFGLFFESKTAKSLADLVVSVKFDLPRRKKAPQPQPSQTRSNSAAEETDLPAAGETPSGQAQSRPVKPSQGQSSHKN